MEEDLPTEFDLIVVGTGLSESIVAAAASRIGKTVLHLDTNEYYGGFWSSFNLESLRKYAEECREYTIDQGAERKEGEALGLKKSATLIENVSERWYNFDEFGNVGEWNRDRILKEFRRFNVDLAPKLLYSRGAMVELLISSNICRYAEFRAVDRVATIWNGRIMTVPCSRSDVFTSRDVNVVEKRLLMKFLQSCASWEAEKEGGDHQAVEVEGKTFLEYLKKQKLTPNLIHYLLYTIAMGNDHTSCRDGLEGVKKFLLSLGRYGNSPFLFPMYGCGEIPQCFCRLCAVFGGVYCLSKPIEGISLKKDGRGFQSLKLAKQTIEAKDLVLGQGYAGEEIFGESEGVKGEQQKEPCGQIARAIFLTNVPLGGASQNTGGGGVLLMKLPPVEGHDDGATIIQLAHFSGTCPKEIYLIHVTAKSTSGDPRLDLEPYVSQVLSKDYPKPPETLAEDEEAQENNVSTILYELYFNIPKCIACQHSAGSLPEGIRMACGPLYELDYDESIARARLIFKNIYPDEEFLPRAPDPEEIIIGDESADQAQEVVASAEESDKVDSAQECQENNASIESAAVVTAQGISDAQEAKEDSIDNAEECLEQK